MRCYDEVIDVRPGLVDGQEAPAQFLWRNRLWMVRDVQTRWVETGPWWDGPAARAVRGDDLDPAAGGGATRESRQSAHALVMDDVLAEEEVWRVVAADGRAGHHGVYELAHACSTGEWRLRTVMD